MRSVLKDDSSLQEAGPSQARLPWMNGESTSSLENIPFRKKPSAKSVSEIQAWELKDPGASRESSLVLKNLDATFQAWEAQALGTPSQGSRVQENSVPEAQMVPVMSCETSPGDVAVTQPQPEELPAPQWSSKTEYILAQVGYSLRAANLWSFPWLWLLNGGVYVIIYIFLLFFIGVPLLLMEMASGQKQRQGSLGVWKLASPWMTGLGYTSFLVCIIQSTLINITNCWSLLYLSQSFQFPLPWEKCPLVKNSSDFDAECARTTPSMYFWYRTIMKVPNVIKMDDPVLPNMSLSLLVIWCLTGAIMINGLKSIGRALYVLTLIPYLIFLGLFIRFPLMEGLSFLLSHLLIFKVPSAQYKNICFLAARQVLNSLGIGLGFIASFSSFMTPSNNCLLDAFLIPLINLGTLVIVTPIIFSVTNFWIIVSRSNCSEKNIEKLMHLVSSGELPPVASPPENIIDNAATMYTDWLNSLPPSVKELILNKVSDCDTKNQLLKVKAGSSFAYLAIIETMSFIPGSAFWSILLFLVILTLGLTSVVAVVQVIITPFQDTSFFKKHPRILIVSVSGLMFLCNLFFAKPSGYYFFRLLSDYWIILPIVILPTAETLAIAWGYGAKRFQTEMKILLGHPVAPLYCGLLCFLCPLVLIAIFVATVIFFSYQDFVYLSWNSTTSKEASQEYPRWLYTFLIILSIVVFLPIPIYCLYCFIHYIFSHPRTFYVPIRISKTLVTRSRKRFSNSYQMQEILKKRNS
ncbi:orphan sodium- and chloride-dependent neurotransmitter transporter NTT5 [Echinops telfairi]|uniref:Orphan sodium- and chloride-dependent neurotransmitter transporter NTT5 n=1 Tax=Echinops telfairi TaxID=9371 RepID=A0AC55DAV3_ECHTE|nr:orphan sodium- and chloride-dependent neurotransmitter transporter NTT5 [Echinops telfairi]